MTSPVDTSVKYFHSAMPGAPVLSGTAGAHLAVLDACLVTGFGLKSVDSLVVANNVATLNISTGHSFEVGTVALVAGATPDTLNGEQKITAITASTAAFATTGVADMTATGTITAKVASAGWSKIFSGVNKAAYKSADVTSTMNVLRVDDTATTAMRASGYESMSDIDTGLGQYPTNAQVTGGLYWSKSDTANATARSWFVCVDSKTMYIGRNVSASIPFMEIGMFGDPVFNRPTGDPYGCTILGPTANRSQGAAATDAQLCYAAAAGGYSARSYTGLGSSIGVGRSFPSSVGSTSGTYSGNVSGGGTIPNPIDGGIYMSPLLYTESTSLRGSFPGVFCSPQLIIQGTYSTGDKIVGVNGLPGRTLRAACSSNGAWSVVFTCFFDTTGPWR